MDNRRLNIGKQSRLRIVESPPTRNEGRDGDWVCSRIGGVLYLFVKQGGIWWKIQADKHSD